MRIQPVTEARAAVALALLLGASIAHANPAPDAAAHAVRQWREHHEPAVMDEFVALLRIPDVSADADDIRRNADWLVQRLTARGIAASQFAVDGANPVVLGAISTPGATRTLAFYAHYDGQPVVPSEWTNPPFEPTLRTRTNEEGGAVIPLTPAQGRFDPEARLYARAAADDKLSIVAMLAALDALRATGQRLKSNIKLVFEGEEEIGSPHLARILAANKDAFAADYWIVCDGPVHPTRRPLVAFGARDIVSLELTVYGPVHELHSGHYGNWAPNPALDLARLLASMKDERGGVRVAHFYDEVEPLGVAERSALAEAPDVDAALMDELGIAETEGAPRKLNDAITLPSLNIKSLSSGHTGAQATNIIPSTATAALDIRLVKGMDPTRTVENVVAHIREQGFHVLDAAPSASTRRAHARIVRVDRGRPAEGAVRTPMDDPFAREVVRTIERIHGPAVKVPNLGGSLPLAEIEHSLGTHTIVVPLANHDDRQHSADENLRIANLWDGIETLAGLLRL